MADRYVSSEWTRHLESRMHWEFYWNQQALMAEYLKSGPRNLVEIGVGSGFAANYLRSKGHRVTTVDLDAAKFPDIVADISTFQPEEAYDAVLAFEILEHIPFDVVVRAVGRMGTYVRDAAFISVPRQQISLMSVKLKLPVVRELSWRIAIPRRKLKIRSHFWEAGMAGVPVEKIESAFQSAGFKAANRFDYLNQMFMHWHKDDISQTQIIE